MKTKFGVEIHAYSTDLSALIKMIATHNEGVNNIDLDVFSAYVKANNAQYLSEESKCTVKQSDETTIEFFSGSKHILTITEKQYIGELNNDTGFEKWLTDYYKPSTTDGYFLAKNCDYPLLSKEQLRKTWESEMQEKLS